ncbi:MAG: hypothetical protein Q8865_09130 [Bacillota bacterium]|nr:hypothetical protein [Bacillota bacterium]
MTIERKIKRAAQSVAVDIALKRMRRSPERCARNLVELGSASCAHRLSRSEFKEIYDKLLAICRESDEEAAREMFFMTFACNE